MKKFEYKIEEIESYSDSKYIKRLDELGSEGWKLSTRVSRLSTHIFYREIEEDNSLPEDNVIVTCIKSNGYEYVNYCIDGKWQVLTPDGSDIVSWRHLTQDDLNKYLSKNFELKRPKLNIDLPKEALDILDEIIDINKKFQEKVKEIFK